MSRRNAEPTRLRPDWRFIDLRLTHIDAALRFIAPCLPLALADSTVTPTIAYPHGDDPPTTGDGDHLLIVELRYTLRGDDATGRTAFTADITMALLFLTDTALAEDRSDVEQQMPALLLLADPYLREMTHTLTQQMGLPPLLLDLPHDLYTITVPEPATA